MFLLHTISAQRGVTPAQKVATPAPYVSPTAQETTPLGIAGPQTVPGTLVADTPDAVAAEEAGDAVGSLPSEFRSPAPSRVLSCRLSLSRGEPVDEVSITCHVIAMDMLCSVKAKNSQLDHSSDRKLL